MWCGVVLCGAVLCGAVFFGAVCIRVILFTGHQPCVLSCCFWSWTHAIEYALRVSLNRLQLAVNTFWETAAHGQIIDSIYGKKGEKKIELYYSYVLFVCNYWYVYYGSCCKEA